MWLAIALCAAGVGAWRWFPRRSSKPPVRNVALIFSGDSAGWITPCGCTALQAGGLPRRGAYIASAAGNADVVYADVGGAPAGTSAYQRLKFETALRGELAMGLAAHNIGGPEAALGADYLREVAGRLGVPLVSANLRDARGASVAAPFRIVSAGERRIALAGVLSPRYRSASIQIEDPRTSILSAVVPHKQQYDVLVVLAYLPEADIVMGGPTGQNMSMRRIGPVLLASATNMGKFLVQIDLPIGSNSPTWATRAVEMGPALTDDAHQTAILDDYVERLRQADFASTETGLVAQPATYPAGFAIGPPESCAPCHQQAYDVWKSSKHARAWETIRAKNSHVDPYCQKCHTEGYGLPGGFVSIGRSASMVNVNCQDCHGPSAAHAETCQKKDPHAVATPYAGQAKQRCVNCHDPENDPNFSVLGFDARWASIRHDKLAPAATRPSTLPGQEEEP
jgi:hypothetical protein